RSLRRELRSCVPAGTLDFSSNDYLDMARHPRVRAALSHARVGSGGSRLLSGAHVEHAELERVLARWVGRERALLFSSGYLAVLGAVVTLAPFARHAYANAENHACAIDALRLTKLPRTLFAHGALPPAAARVEPALIVTESSFGMSGIRTDIAALVATLGPSDVAVIDEAHALGVDGPNGAGACARHADERLIVIGTLSKALGGAGGFVAGPADAIDLLATAARTFVFETAPPPALAAAMLVAVEIVAGDEGERRRARLRENVDVLHEALLARDVTVARSGGPVVPILIGDAAEAFALGAALERRGIYAPAIRPPTVAAGRSQLRITVRSDHTHAELRAFANALAAVRHTYA
ncbi:MAG: aminotransferase class I/II-fold pyridoxal phosphate-dependent enzyme, partial [Candidatus Eremiobacteraeota bacterium]|nr:aminotransferase class I/II-fold pyridoxal phosphate-dependent enzyme [Candidatus Eremiobacteraeota bacterium]